MSKKYIHLNYSFMKNPDMLNETAQQETEALQAIYGQDFSQEIVLVKEAWKNSTQHVAYSIRLFPRAEIQNKIVLTVRYSYALNYPEQPPVFTLADISGLTNNQVLSINNLITQNVALNSGNEMVFSICSVIEDYLTERVSSYSLMDNMVNQIHLNEQAQDEENYLKTLNLSKIKDDLNVEIIRLTNLEIEAKELILSENMFEKEYYQKIGNILLSSIPRHNCALFFDGVSANKDKYTIIQVPYSSNIDFGKFRTETLTHKNPNVAIMEDYDIRDSQLRILTQNVFNVSLTDVIKISGYIEKKKSLLILHDLLSFLDDFGEIDVSLSPFSDLWFRSDGKIELLAVLLSNFCRMEHLKAKNRHWYRANLTEGNYLVVPCRKEIWRG